HIGLFFHRIRQPGIVSNEERQSAGIGNHVLLNELCKCFRCPGFSFRIERHDAIRGFELQFFEFGNFQWQAMFDDRDVIFAELCGCRALRLSDPHDAKLHSMPYFLRFSSNVFRLMPRIFAALTFLPRICRSTSVMYFFSISSRDGSFVPEWDGAYQGG